jgi:nicotinamidase-related amidase
VTESYVERIEDPFVGGAINDWYESLPIVPYKNGGVVVIDMINGFVHEGPLSGPRVARLMLPIRRFVQGAKDKGSRLFVSLQDTHSSDAIEFKSYPPHAIAGTKECELIPELSSLDVEWAVFEKDTLNVAASPRAAFNAALLGWSEKRNPQQNAYAKYTTTFWLVGNCTDLCVYQTAMQMRQFYSSFALNPRIVVVANLTDTYDAPWHPGDFYHRLFLKHMEQNGIEIVRDVAF